MGKVDDSVAGFGKRIRAYRAANNYTQEQLGNMIYISSTALSKVENGRSCPSFNMIHCIREKTCCNVDWLITGVKSEAVELEDLLITFNASPEMYEQSSDRIILYGVNNLRAKLFPVHEDSFWMKDSDRYNFNLQLAERVCRECDNKAEEGQVFNLIRKTTGLSIKEMAEILTIKSDRYSYLEKNGRPSLQEMIKLYDILGINPGFVISGRCQDMSAISEMLNIVKGGKALSEG